MLTLQELTEITSDIKEIITPFQKDGRMDDSRLPADVREPYIRLCENFLSKQTPKNDNEFYQAMHFSTMKYILFVMFIVEMADGYCDEDKDRIFMNLCKLYKRIETNYQTSLEEYAELKMLSESLDELYKE